MTPSSKKQLETTSCGSNCIWQTQATSFYQPATCLENKQNVTVITIHIYPSEHRESKQVEAMLRRWGRNWKVHVN